MSAKLLAFQLIPYCLVLHQKGIILVFQSLEWTHKYIYIPEII